MINLFNLETTQRTDILTLQTAGLAIKLDSMKDKMSSPSIPLKYESLTLPPDLMKSNTTNIDFHNLPNLIKHEIDQSPTNKNLQNTSTVNLHKTLIDIQKQNNIITRIQGFHQHESKDFHISKLLKLLESHTLTGDSL